MSIFAKDSSSNTTHNNNKYSYSTNNNNNNSNGNSKNNGSSSSSSIATNNNTNGKNNEQILMSSRKTTRKKKSMTWFILHTFLCLCIFVITITIISIGFPNYSYIKTNNNNIYYNNYYSYYFNNNNNNNNNNSTSSKKKYDISLITTSKSSNHIRSNTAAVAAAQKRIIHPSTTTSNSNTITTTTNTVDKDGGITTTITDGDTTTITYTVDNNNDDINYDGVTDSVTVDDSSVTDSVTDSVTTVDSSVTTDSVTTTTKSLLKLPQLSNDLGIKGRFVDIAQKVLELRTKQPKGIKYNFPLTPIVPNNISMYEQLNINSSDKYSGRIWEQKLKIKQLYNATIYNTIYNSKPVQPIQVYEFNNKANNDDNNNNNDNKPIISIITSTRSTPNTTYIQDSLLYKHLIKSIIKTMHHDEQIVWNIKLYVAFDDTDIWWKEHVNDFQLQNSDLLPSWLHVIFAQYPDIPNHIPFNEIALYAYNNNNDNNNNNTTPVDYLCRVNDDTEFQSVGWVSLAVSTLQSMKPISNFGVVGPKCGQGNSLILTHDFVHAPTHMNIFNGLYYPPIFQNWYLDDWITTIYSNRVLLSDNSHIQQIKSWKVKHWVYKTRYIYNEIDASFLQHELIYGHYLLYQYLLKYYPQYVITTNNSNNNNLVITDNNDENIKLIAPTLPGPKEVHPDILDSILTVISNNTNANILIWGLDLDSQYWHRITNGRVLFLEDKSPSRKKGWQVWRDHVRSQYPYIVYDKVKYWTPSGKQDDTYYNYVHGQDNNNNEWCDLQIALFPQHTYETYWDIILVDAPEGVHGSTKGKDDIGPGIFEPLYMTKVIIANQTARYNNSNNNEHSKRPIHVFVDDFHRKYEKEFSQKLFNKEPTDIVTLPTTDTDGTSKEHGHFIIEPNIDNIPIQDCIPPPIQDSDAYPIGKGDLITAQVDAVLDALPRKGNMLVWGLGHDSYFWHQATLGRVVFLEDINREPVEALNNMTFYNNITQKYPDMEIYQIQYTSKNNKEYINRYSAYNQYWTELIMDEQTHKIPNFLTSVFWDVILVDGPLGCCEDIGPGRLQSLYMTKILAQTILTQPGNNNSNNIDAITKSSITIFVDDHERYVESTMSTKFYGKKPIKVFKPKKKKSKDKKKQDEKPVHELAKFILDRSDFLSDNEINNFVEQVRTLSRERSSVIRTKSLYPIDAQITWNQVESILHVLPKDGNLLVWGLGNDSPFWSQTTLGRVMFLEDGNDSTNDINGKRWYDHIMALHPYLDAYTIDYTTTNTKESYNRYVGHPEIWDELIIKDDNGFPNDIWDISWDVILVDAPLGCCDMGPARYQSIYMTQLIVKEIMKKVNNSNNKRVHVFVDDYERSVEREFSRECFGKQPIEITKRGSEKEPKEQAHFVFDDDGAILVPWKNPDIGKDFGPLSPLNSVNDWVILLEVNDGFYDFFLNWLDHFNKLNININVIVIAEDDEVGTKIKSDIIPTNPQISVERSQLDLGPIAFSYATPNYKMMVSARARHILEKLQMDKHVLYSDVDTVWRSSPLPFLAFNDDNNIDMIIQVDTKEYNGVSPYYCTGFMAILSNERTKRFIADWKGALESSSQLNQPIFNDILHKRSNIRHQPLPYMEFPSGQKYFDEYTSGLRERAVVVHNNYIQGHDAKQKRFEKHGLWII